MHLVSPRPSPGKMYEVKRKGETGTGFSEISSDLIIGAMHVMPAILMVLLIKIYVNVKCKFCLYHIDICNFSCNFSSFIQVKSFNQKEKCAILFSLYSTDPLKNMCLVIYFLIDLLT